jgi:hypothetical protein
VPLKRQPWEPRYDQPEDAANYNERLAGIKLFHGGLIDLAFEALHRFQGDVEKVARAAGRVEHFDRAEVQPEPCLALRSHLRSYPHRSSVAAAVPDLFQAHFGEGGRIQNELLTHQKSQFRLSGRGRHRGGRRRPSFPMWELIAHGHLRMDLYLFKVFLLFELYFGVPLRGALVADTAARRNPKPDHAQSLCVHTESRIIAVPSPVCAR